MKKTAFWLIAVLITVSTAIYQRLSGPTYPVRGTVQVKDSEIAYKLARSHESTRDYEVGIKVQDKEITGYLMYKRHKTADSWVKIPLVRKEDLLVGSLPHQPPAGKLEYKVILSYEEEEISLSGEKPVIIRFKGAVPAAILIPHVIIMFLAMLFSTRAGIEALDLKSNPRKYALWATGLLLVGGLVFGPLVQKFAFGDFWTGVPFGYDLTDNKTLIAMIGWIVAVIAGRGGRPARWWVLGASILLMAVYLIPHSLLGSELDYSKMNIPASALKTSTSRDMKLIYPFSMNNLLFEFLFEEKYIMNSPHKP